MKHSIVLSAIFMTLCLPGCKSPKTKPPSPDTEYSISRDNVFSAGILELSKIVPSACDTLGITIKETSEGQGQSQWICTSLAGMNIKLDATALVKRRSHLRISVQGDKHLANALQNEIMRGLHDSIRSYRQENP